MVDPLPPETQKQFDICQDKLGLIPTCRAYAFDIDKLNAFTIYNDLMLADSGVSKLEREMIAVVSLGQLPRLLPDRPRSSGSRDVRQSSFGRAFDHELSRR